MIIAHRIDREDSYTPTDFLKTSVEKQQQHDKKEGGGENYFAPTCVYAHPPPQTLHALHFIALSVSLSCYDA